MNFQWWTATTHLVVKLSIFHEMKMSLDVCENRCLASTWAKIVITWNERPDDVLEMPTNAWSSSRDLMKLTDDGSQVIQVNLNNKTYQLHHTFRKLVLFMWIPTRSIPCFSHPRILNFFIRKTIVRQDPILKDIHSFQKTTLNNKWVVFDTGRPEGTMLL